MAESVIAMMAEFRDEVLAGARTSATRPGHRDYQVGPATIRFLRQTRTSAHWSASDHPIDVWITKVEHKVAEDRMAVFVQFLHEHAGEPESQGRITVITWVLV